MWRISKLPGKITQIEKGNRQDIDSLIIIPGVTQFNSITTKDNVLSFNNSEWQENIQVYFANVGELERFLTQIFRDNKIDNVLKK